MTPSNHKIAFALWLSVALAGACGGGERQPAAASNDVTWDTLPSGALHATYSSLPVLPFNTTPDLRIGGSGATGTSALGDVRGIAVDPGGAVLVLDGQASELRAFDARGAYLGTVMRKGQGPGEIVQANGLRIDTLGVVWINDVGRGKVTRLNQRERQVTDYPILSGAQGYLWEGGVTHDGRIWDAVRDARDPTGAPVEPNQTGPQQTQAHLFFRSLDPRTGAVDSVALGVETRQVAVYPGVSAIVPFTGTPLVALDPAGAIWTASSDAYHLIKHSLKGDTLLILDLPASGPDVSADERAQEIARLTAFLADVRKRGGAGKGSESTDWEAVVPKKKPLLVSLSVDDQSRLWVQRRTLSRGPVFDVIGPTGQLLALVDPDFEPWPFFPPVVHGNNMLALVTDSAGVPMVVRGPVALR